MDCPLYSALYGVRRSAVLKDTLVTCFRFRKKKIGFFRRLTRFFPCTGAICACCSPQLPKLFSVFVSPDTVNIATFSACVNKNYRNFFRFMLCKCAETASRRGEYSSPAFLQDFIFSVYCLGISKREPFARNRAIDRIYRSCCRVNSRITAVSSCVNFRSVLITFPSFHLRLPTSSVVPITVMLS